jgi:hypothetical protein
LNIFIKIIKFIKKEGSNSFKIYKKYLECPHPRTKLCTPDDAAHLDAIDKELNATI